MLLPWKECGCRRVPGPFLFTPRFLARFLARFLRQAGAAWNLGCGWIDL